MKTKKRHNSKTGFSLEPIGIELVLGQNGFTPPFETFVFHPNRLFVSSDNNPSSSLEFFLEKEKVPDLISSLIEGNLMRASVNRRNRSTSDTSLRFIMPSELEGGPPNVWVTKFCRKHRLEESDRAHGALSELLSVVKAVESYRRNGILPKWMGLFSVPMSETDSSESWDVLDVVALEYEIGNEHSPTDRIGRQILKLTRDDHYECTWIRRDGTRVFDGRVRNGLFAELILSLLTSGFPSVPSAVAPPGGAIATYRLQLSGQELSAYVYPPKAESNEHLGHVQKLLNQLSRELAGGKRDPSQRLLLKE